MNHLLIHTLADRPLDIVGNVHGGIDALCSVMSHLVFYLMVDRSPSSSWVALTI